MVNSEHFRYLQVLLEIALPHVVVAHVVDDLPRELVRVGGHVAVHEQVAAHDLEPVLEHWDYCSWVEITFGLINYLNTGQKRKRNIHYMSLDSNLILHIVVLAASPAGNINYFQY